MKRFENISSDTHITDAVQRMSFVSKIKQDSCVTLCEFTIIISSSMKGISHPVITLFIMNHWIIPYLLIQQVRDCLFCVLLVKISIKIMYFWP